jgi:Ca2+-binding RTX toxin-like protein
MVVMIRHDLEFILNQIIISEQHAAGADLASLLPNPFLPYGLRTVDGTYNNLLPGQEQFGAADNPFPRALDPHFLNDADGDVMPLGPFPAPVITNTNYGLPGSVADADPRIISNLISDQTISNTAAVDAAGGLFFDDLGNAIIPNTAPDEGLSAPFNSWMTLFGQFFDHGLDLVTKGNNGTVYIPLQPDDPLYVPGSATNFMALTRATPVLVDGEIQHTNTTTSWIDQNQTYTSHASHQVFLREYEFDGAGNAVSTGHLVEGAGGGLANWTEIKAQALEMLGITLNDFDIGNVPLLKTDQYGKFIPGPNGYAQVAVSVFETVEGVTTEYPVFIEGTETGLDINNLSLPVPGFTPTPGGSVALSVMRTGHAFLDDIAHHAAPGFVDDDHNPLTAKIKQVADSDIDANGNGIYDAGDTLTDVNGDGVVTTADFFAADASGLTYDDELLGKHFITGDGRGNENIGLTSVHYIFHAEHNRLVEHIKSVIEATGDATFIAQWKLPDDSWNGERLFQAARFGTEMQYQHLVFEEFGRKVQPMINLFGSYDATIDPSIVAEFAHVVYRFGHSMLNETIDRFSPTFAEDHIGLIEGFLNPVEFTDNGAVSQAVAAGAIVRGMTRQVGNEIDEFVIEGLRNNLLGLPLDLATLNIARARETGVPTLNEARRQFFEGTGDAQLKPYENWVDFAQNAKNPLSVVNFIAAYGKHEALQADDVDTLQEKRDVAWALVTGETATITDFITAPDGTVTEVARDFTPDDQDRIDFLNSQGIYANLANGATVTGVDDIDFWIGGLAEAKMPFGGMLGSTFNFVFETQMEALQDGDRFYYLGRTAGLSFLNELEGNSFASLIMQHTDTKHLPGDVFSTPKYILEVTKANQFNQGEGIDGKDDPIGGSIFAPLVSRNNPATPGPDGNYLKFNGGDHVVLGGTENADILIGGLGDDTLWGDGGKDRLEGGAGNDFLIGGDGDDILTDSFGDDNIKGGNGNDVIQAGQGFDLILAGDGIDFVVGGEDPDETFGGGGSDFISAGEDTSTVFGGAGDDWIEGGAGNDLLIGDNGDPFANGNVPGNDVFIGQAGDDDYDSEAGDDIMVLGAGIDRAEGMQGFDWATYLNEAPGQGIEADMNVRAFAPPPLPGSPNAFLDRFDMTEGLSGTASSDILRGDDSNAATMVGHELTNFSLISGLKGGLNPFFGADVTQFNGGNILLGGDGSDIIEGRGGNDIIDGDAWLNVRLEVTIPNADPLGEPTVFSAKSMSEIQSRLLSGEINPSQIKVVREILRTEATDTDFDTAVFSGNLVDTVTGSSLYTIEGLGFDLLGNAFAEDLNNDGFISVSHDEGGIGLGADGVDLLRGIERLQFADTLLVIGGKNEAPDGLLVLNNLTPQEDDGNPATNEAVTVSLSFMSGGLDGIVGDNPATAGVNEAADDALVYTITDADNVTASNPNGEVRSGVTFFWQIEVEPDSGIFVDLERTLQGEIVKVTGTSFTPTDAEVGQALRVRGVYQDANGVIESVYSQVATAVAGVNDLPVGTLLISNMTPAEDAPLTAINQFTDVDGLNGVAFTYAWEAFNGTQWVAVGDGSATFAPPQSTVGQTLRVTVTYTDGQGFENSVMSATTAAVINTQDAATGSIELSTFEPAFGAPISATPFVEDEDGLGPNPGFSYQWFQAADEFSAWVAIDGATSSSFTPTSGLSPNAVQPGYLLKVQVRFTDITGHQEMVESLSTGPVGLVNFDPTGALVINDLTPTETLVLTATDTVADANGISVGAKSYQWESSADNGATWVAIGGADALTFTPGQAQVGLVLRVVVTFTDDVGYIERVESLPTEIVGDQNAGTAANDVIDGTAGQDLLNGGAGRDTISGGAERDVITGGAGRDTLNGDGGADTLTGGADRDIIDGGAGADTINYTIGDGADSVDGGTGNDTLNITGTAGANTLDVLFNGTSITLFDGSTATNVETFNVDLLAGTDTLTYAPVGGGVVTTANITVNLQAGTASGFSAIAGIENVVGGSGNDTLRGSTLANTLNGGAGDDRFVAFNNDGNDAYTGGLGTDTLDLSLTNAAATVTTVSAQSARIGNDTLNSIENIIGSQGNDTITMGGGVNVINGGGGADTINAGGGNDTITGGAGNDILNGGADNDTFIFASGFGADTITGFDALAAGGQDRLQLSSSLGVTLANFTTMVNISNSAGNTLITIGTDTITLLGVNSANVDASDFLFGP